MKGFALILGLLTMAGAASGQTRLSSPPASTAGTAGVKQHLQSQHFGNVRNLHRGPDGQWTGKATQNGVEKTVKVSPNGSMSAR